MPEHPNPKLRIPEEPPEERFAPAEPDYAELEVATNFSFLRGASHADEMVLQAARHGYRAIGVTDYNTLAGVVRMHDAAKQIRQRNGWAPRLLIGARLTFADGSPDLLAYATDRAAYGRLCRLLSTGKRRAEKGECTLYLDDFLDHQEGLLTAAVPVELTASSATLKNGALTRSPLARLRDALGDRLSLATSCLYSPDDAGRLRQIAQLARTFNIPLLATNGVHYHAPQRRPLQDVLTCIRHGCTIHDAGFKLFPNGERYLKPPAQMHRLFADCPETLRRGIELAERCSFSLDELRYEYPDEVVPAGKTVAGHLADLTWDGAATRYPAGVPQKIRDLIDKELRVISEQRWEAYFLTVHDLVNYARSREILCQGRGSAANSAVCYCLGVTSVDPDRIDVLFERFISAARGEPPDIDIDFEHERREEVIQYLYEKYGRERCAMTAEVITYRGRSAVRDVGKALGLSLDLVDQMAKRLDWWHRGTLDEKQLREVGLDPADSTIRTVVDLTGELLGFPRHLSQHVGGMVMTHGPLCEMVPIENASMVDRTVIEWDKDDIDTVGILKVDALALGMLTCISKAFKLLNCTHESTKARRAFVPWCLPSVPLELHTLPPEDPQTYDMICDADTIGVFQIESRAQMTMLPRLKPRKFYDLVIEVAIVRPGPIQGNMVHPYLRRRNGEESVVYPSEELRAVLEKTLGVPLFQEQAMRIAMVGAGFSAEESDQLRRAMAAWRKTGALEAFHGKIVRGMLANGYTGEFAEQCWLQIRGFGEYGFPESHSASFALLVYASAWIKRHHPAAFATALLNSQPMGFYAPAQIVRDAKEHGVEVRPIDVNHSDWDCTLEEGATSQGPEAGSVKENWGRGGPALRLGFRQIKGMSEAHGHVIVAARRQAGRFTSVEQFHRATELPRHALRRLAEADAFASLGLSRRQALWQVLAIRDEKAPLFDQCEEENHGLVARVTGHHVDLPPMPLAHEVMIDYRTAGLSLKRHPISLLRDQLDKLHVTTAAELNRLPAGRWVKVAGLVLIRQRPGTASGIVFETIEDETGIANLIIRPDLYERHRAAARHAALLQAEGYVEREGQVLHVMAKRLTDLSHLLPGYVLSSRDFH
jgi:error-prone DNA polymerase